MKDSLDRFLIGTALVGAIYFAIGIAATVAISLSEAKTRQACLAAGHDPVAVCGVKP